jgi:predicted metal-dependent phosphoesterase TrpH
MKIELHLHTSRYSACAQDRPRDMMDRLVAMDYGAVYLTEHDAVWPDEEIAALQARFPKLRIFPGVELSIGELWSFQHLLVLGTNDAEYLQMAESAQPDVRGILDKAAAAGHLTILAHPCRWEGGDEIIRRGLLPDALEFRTCNHNAKAGEMAKRTADWLHLPLVNADDAHSVEMVGRFWIETEHPLVLAEDVREIVLGGQYANRDADPPLP